MSENLSQLYVDQFSTNLKLKLQQTTSKLRGRVMEGTHTGAKQASPIQYMGPVKMRAPAGRFAPKNRTDADFTRRWIFPIDRELDQLIDSFDELKTIVDPKSQYSTNAAQAAAREWDDQLIAAATATAKIGTDGASLSDEAFNTTDYRIADTFGSSAASGLTVAKLIEARRKFRKAQVDLEAEEITVVAGSQQESDLLNQVEVVSKEFSDKPTLMDGKVTRFLGMNIVYSERLPTYTTNTRGVLAFVKSGLYLGVWKDLMSKASIRNDLSGEPWDLYTAMSSGATRLEPGRLLQIACLDSTGADVTP